MSDYTYSDSSVDSLWSSNTNNYGSNYNYHSRMGGLFDPVHFSTALVTLLILFVLYLLLPRGIRKQYFGAHPKRHAWSTRSTSLRGSGGASSQQKQKRGDGSIPSTAAAAAAGSTYYGGGGSGGGSLYTTGNMTQSTIQSTLAAAAISGYPNNNSMRNNNQMMQQQQKQSGMTPSSAQHHQSGSVVSTNTHQHENDIVVSAAMQQLRDPGVLIVAHGSRGKPKTVRLSLTETAITWRTESRKQQNNTTNTTSSTALPKLGKLHAVPLSHIMYVDVGKQTTALRRVENAPVPETLCFSLLTKEGSLDLEAASPRERDALVACFSLVLDEVHAQNWRDIYRGPSSDLPSSFDELDPSNAMLLQQQQQSRRPN